MDITSTPFISYSDINTDLTDIYDDAWGFSSEFSDVFSKLNEYLPEPGDALITRISGFAGIA